MELRVTPQVQIAQAEYYTQIQTDQLAVLQQQMSSGLKLQKPSDDPLAMVEDLAQKAQDLRLTMYQGNISSAQTVLNNSVSTLTQASDLFKQAKSLAIQGGDSSLDSNARLALAAQVNSALENLVSLANSQQTGQYLYSGTASSTPPFKVTRDAGGQITGVSYQGSEQNAADIVNKNQTVDTLFAGDAVFQQRARTTTQYTGPTGAAAGTGTDSAIGQGALLVQHTTTTFAPGSGVTAGLSSPANDTILGPAGANNLTIIDTSGTGAAGTVSLNGGAPIAFTNANNNLKVSGPNGEVVYVNTTAITPGFSGGVALTANGTLSVDNGASTVPINFSANQVVTNSQTGAITNVNSTNIRQAGTDQLNYTGTYDAFQALIALRNDLQNTQGLTDSQIAQSVSNRIGEIDRVNNSILQVVGQQSSSLLNLDGVNQRAQSMQLSIQERIGNLESADITGVVVALQSQQNLFKMTLAASAQIFNQNLLNFLK